MADKLTKRVVDSVEAGPGPVFVWDTEIKGFGLRVDPNGRKTFILRYRPKKDGKAGRAAPKRFVTIGRMGDLTPDKARAKAQKIIGQVADEKDPAGAARARRDLDTVGDLIDAFLDEYARPKKKPRTADAYDDLLNRLARPVLGRLKAVDLTKQHVSKLVSQVGKKTRTQANRLQAALSSMYSWALDEGRAQLPDGFVNPAMSVKRFPEAKKERFLTTEELARLGAVLDQAERGELMWVPRADGKVKHAPKPENRVVNVSPFVIAALRLLALTGCRVFEILNLKWSEVDFERGLLLLEDSKTGKKTVVLNSAAMALLADLPRAGKYVIAGADPEKPRTDLPSWPAIRRAAGLDGVRLHDLRHSFASVGVAAGMGLPIVGKLLGHTQAATTARYAHLGDHPVRRASEQIGETIAAAMAGKPKAKVVRIGGR
jgi:integrase